MSALKDAGVDTDALIASVDNETQLEPCWHPLPHSEFDGIGAFGHLLRQHGHPDLKVLPQHHPGKPPRLVPLLRAGARFTEFPIGRGGSLVLASRSLTPQPRNIAWHVLDQVRTREVIARAKKEAVSVSSWLLFTLGRAIEPFLDAPDRPSRWMIPVNMRGEIRGPRDTANHVSYLRVKVSRTDSARSIEDKVRAHLAGAEHWWLWYCYRYGSFVGSWGMRILVRADMRLGKPYIGCFSNLGNWDLSGPSAWICCPPVAKTMPVGAGCITYGGRMGLALRFHSSYDNVAAIADDTLKDWVHKAGS